LSSAVFVVFWVNRDLQRVASIRLQLKNYRITVTEPGQEFDYFSVVAAMAQRKMP
jgi:hypothetical protein